MSDWSPPLLRFVSSEEWDSLVQRPLRYWCELCGPELRRVTVQLRNWSARIASDSAEWIRLAGIDWRPVFGTGQPTVDVYVSSDVPEALPELAGAPGTNRQRAYGVVDQARGLCWVGGVFDYRGLRRAVFETLSGTLVIRHRPRNSSRPRWIGAPAATLEWPQIPGRHKGLAILGPHRLRTAHGFLLSRYAEGATVAALDWSFFSPRSSEATPGDGYLLVPGSFARLFPALRSILILAESAAPERYPARNTLLAYQAPEDLDRGIATGDVSREELATLLNQVSAPDHWLLVDPEQLVGEEHLADAARVATWVAITDQTSRDGKATEDWLVRSASSDLICSTLLRECFAYHGEEAERVVRRSLAGWLDRKTHRFFEVNAGYHLLLSHLLVRFALADVASEARLLKGTDVPHDLTEHLGIVWQDTKWLWERRREVDVVGLFDRKGELKYALVFDHHAAVGETMDDPFAVLLAVWPGQIADFFTRHRFLNPRRLLSSALPW